MLPKNRLEEEQRAARDRNAVDTDNLCPACGRLAAKVHCPTCGSYCVYGYSKQDIMRREDGTPRYLARFRCQRCGKIFNDDDWQLRCTAIPVNAGRMSHKAIEPQTKFNSLDDAPSEMVEALRRVQEMRRKREGG